MILANAILQGTRSAQPAAAATNAGMLYGVTDEGNKIERSDGSVWQAYSPIATPALIGKATEVTVGQGTVVSTSIEVTAGIALTIDAGAWVEVIGGNPEPLDTLTLLRQPPGVAAINLSTLGVIDWLYPNGTTTLPRQVGAGTLHAKATGEGDLALSFDWIFAGASPTLFTQNSGGTFLITTMAGDEMDAALSGADNGQGLFTTAGATYGFRLKVPAVRQVRHLVLGVSNFSCAATLTATLFGQTKTVQTFTYPGTNNATDFHVFTITYSAPFGGALDVNFRLTTALGVSLSPNIKFYFAYIF